MAASSWLCGGLIVLGVADVAAIDLVIGPRALDTPPVEHVVIAAAPLPAPPPVPAPAIAATMPPPPAPEPIPPTAAPRELPPVVILFATDRDALDDAAARALDELAGALADAPDQAVDIIGHADARGTEHHNEELSARRMRRVRDYLAARGVAASRLHGRAVGAREPASTGDDEAALAANRRVEIRRTP